MYIYFHFCHSNENLTYELGSYWFICWRSFLDRSSYHIFPADVMFDKFHLLNKLWHHQELVSMMRMHSAIPLTSSPSREATWKLTIVERKSILHNSKSSFVIWNYGRRITVVIQVRSIFDCGLTERKNLFPLVYPWFGELLLITAMIVISA